jgi:hypothetical protein
MLSVSSPTGAAHGLLYNDCGEMPPPPSAKWSSHHSLGRHLLSPQTTAFTAEHAVPPTPVHLPISQGQEEAPCAGERGPKLAPVRARAARGGPTLSGSSPAKCRDSPTHALVPAPPNALRPTLARACPGEKAAATMGRGALDPRPFPTNTHKSSTKLRYFMRAYTPAYLRHFSNKNTLSNCRPPTRGDASPFVLCVDFRSGPRAPAPSQSNALNVCAPRARARGSHPSFIPARWGRSMRCDWRARSVPRFARDVK